MVTGILERDGSHIRQSAQLPEPEVTYKGRSEMTRFRRLKDSPVSPISNYLEYLGYRVFRTQGLGKKDSEFQVILDFTERFCPMSKYH